MAQPFEVSVTLNQDTGWKVQFKDRAGAITEGEGVRLEDAFERMNDPFLVREIKNAMGLPANAK